MQEFEHVQLVPGIIMGRESVAGMHVQNKSIVLLFIITNSWMMETATTRLAVPGARDHRFLPAIGM
jgi:hypothetical protein